MWPESWGSRRHGRGTAPGDPGDPALPRCSYTPVSTSGFPTADLTASGEERLLWGLPRNLRAWPRRNGPGMAKGGLDTKV